MEWNPPTFKILGIWFTNDLKVKDCEVLNFRENFSKMSFVQYMIKETYNSNWQSSCSEVINFIKKYSPVDFVTKSTRQKCLNCMEHKTRQNKYRTTAVKNSIKGGLGIPNIKNYVNALKLIWLRKLKTSDHKWKE